MEAEVIAVLAVSISLGYLLSLALCFGLAKRWFQFPWGYDPALNGSTWLAVIAFILAPPAALIFMATYRWAVLGRVPKAVAKFTR